MKTSIPHVLSLFTLSSLAHAGEPITLPTETPSISDSLFQFKGDIRGRYEFRETDPADPSHALTVRARLGLLFENNGFSAFVEGEGTQGLIEDFRSNPAAPVTSPYAVSYTHLTLPTILLV